MKYLFVTMSLLNLCTNAQDNVKLTGKITNPTGPKCYLYYFKENKSTLQFEQIYLDSSALDNEGNFSLSCRIEEPLEVTFSDGNEHTSLVIQNGDNLNLTLNTLLFDETILYSGIGSERNNALTRVYLIDEQRNSNLYYNNAPTDTVKQFNYLDSTGKILEDIVIQYQRTFSLCSGTLQKYLLGKDDLKNQIRQQYAFNEKMKSIEGQLFEDFSGIGLNGQRIKLSEFKGKPIIIDFWATWCGPCKMELPHFINYEKTYVNDVNFISVCIWSKEDDWKNMAAKNGLKNNIFLSDDDLKKLSKYDIYYVPRFIALDKNMNIISGQASTPSNNTWQTQYFK